MHWVHDLNPFLFHFPEGLPLLGGLGIRYYGLSYIVGFVLGYLLLNYYHRKNRSPYNSDQILDLVTFSVAGVLIGGRVGYVLLYDFHGFLHNPLSLFAFWQGGMASHGGMLGAALAIVLFAHLRRQSLLLTGDLVVSTAGAGLFLGRVANFINGELWGTPTQLPWGVVFPLADALPRHPSQLYQAFGEGLLLFAYLQLRFWAVLGKQPKPGQLTAEFFIFYSLARIVGELFREPDAPMIIGLSRGQFYSLATLAAGIILLWITIRKTTPASPQTESN